MVMLSHMKITACSCRYLAQLPKIAALVLLTLFIGACKNDVSDRNIAAVDLPTVRRAIDSTKPGEFVIVDARTPQQFDAGHLPKAINVPITALPDGGRPPASVERAKQVIVYGEDPGSAFATGIAKRIYLSGQKKVRVFRGGYKAWVQAGERVEKPEQASQPAGATAPAP